MEFPKERIEKEYTLSLCYYFCPVCLEKALEKVSNRFPLISNVFQRSLDFRVVLFVGFICSKTNIIEFAVITEI